MSTFLTGNDGGFFAGTNHSANFNVWNASVSRVSSDVTGFGDAGRRRRLGVWDITGSAGGFLIADSSNSKPGINTTNWLTAGQAIYLHAKGSGTVATNATNVCTLVTTAVISNIAISVAKTGDAAISLDFENSGGTIPIEVWDEA
jgi:hypothetical protein